MAVAHYLEALAWQRDVVQIHTVFGGKNPHPNFLVGGSPVGISVSVDQPSAGPSGGASATAVSMVGLERVRNVINAMRTFVDQVYVPDTLAIASFYRDWARQGEGIGNFMTYGDFPTKGMNDVASFMVPRGVILDRDVTKVHELDLNAEGEIQEFVAHSWYEYSAGKDKGLHPYQGETKFAYTGPKPPYEHLDTQQSYSWLKSPRWKGKPMEVGPLARALMLYATGNKQAQELVDMTLKKLDLPVQALFSTLGRTAARTLETKIFVDAMDSWYGQLIANIKAGDVRTFNEKLWDPSTWPSEAKGVGYAEAPRGGLAHWIVIKDGKIANYQAVVPSTWNAGPRDAQGQDGPYEAALKGHLLHDPKQPIEILRTIHSFDPCIACAVHVTNPAGEELIKVKVQ
jgi:hydrogenase large subunit